MNFAFPTKNFDSDSMQSERVNFPEFSPLQDENCPTDPFHPSYLKYENLNYIRNDQAITTPNNESKNDEKYATSFIKDLKISKTRGLKKKIFLKKQSGIIKSIMASLNKIKAKNLKNISFLKFEFIKDANPQKKIQKSNGDTDAQNKKGHHKNLPKILGNAIISFASNKQNQILIEQFLNKSSKYLDYPTQWPKLSFESLQTWLIEKNMKLNFARLKIFREVWGYNLFEYRDKIIEDQHFCYVLRKISKYYIENEFYISIFQKVNSETMQIENALCYMDKIAVFTRGLKNPNDLKNII